MEILIQIDENILLFIQEYLRRDWMNGFWSTVTHLGDSGFIWILIGVLLLIFKRTRKAGAAVLLALIFGAVITNVILKNVIARIRPYEVIEGLHLLIERQHDFSFPSGHACAAFSGAMALYRTIPRRYGICALVFAGLIALSRLYVGVHYPTDVMAGVLIGIFSGWAAWKVMEFIMEKKRKTGK